MSWLQTAKGNNSSSKWEDMKVKITQLKTLFLRDKSILIITVNVVGFQKKKLPQLAYD